MITLSQTMLENFLLITQVSWQGTSFQYAICQTLAENILGSLIFITKIFAWKSYSKIVIVACRYKIMAIFQIFLLKTFARSMCTSYRNESVKFLFIIWIFQKPSWYAWFLKPLNDYFVRVRSFDFCM